MLPRLLAIIFVVASAGVGCRPAAQQGGISGQVVDTEAKPIAGAAVTWFPSEPGVGGALTKNADANGQFEFPLARFPGDLSVMAKGYGQHRESFLASGSVVHVVLPGSGDSANAIER